MLSFKKVALEDKDWVEKCMKAAGFRGSEFTFSNLFNWRDGYELTIAGFEGFLLIKSGSGDDASYMYPIGEGDMAAAVQAIRDDAAQNGIVFSMYGIPEERIEEVQCLLGDEYDIEPVRDNFDYIYTRESLATLSGKKLHGKRNHINKFLSLYPDWSVEAINADNIGEAWKMNLEWCSRQECVSHSLKKESCAVENAFANFFELGLTGAMLKVNGNVVAYTMGNEVTDDTFVVHIEKAFTDTEGAYTMINREFVKMLPEKYLYINREDDVGDPGLRKAKESYRPAMMYERYNAVLKDE